MPSTNAIPLGQESGGSSGFGAALATGASELATGTGCSRTKACCSIAGGTSAF
jgi:hypothetical protein